jgi:uncharacterized HAD superfamily protein
MRIAVDLDEVLAQFLQSFIDFHNEKYGTHFKLSDFHSYHLHNAWGGTVEEAIEKVYQFHKTDHFKNIRPVQDAQESLQKLKKGNEIFIVTSRQNEIMHETEVWLDKHFPDTFSGIHFANHFSKSGIKRTKKEICDELGIEVLIEDSPDYAIECIKPGRKIFLLNYPWNKERKVPNEIQRVDSWKEILEKI